MTGGDGYAPYQQARVDNLIIQFHNRIHNDLGGRSLPAKVRCPMGVFGDFPSIMVSRDFPLIAALDFGIRQVINIVTNRKDHLICHQLLLHKV